MSDIKTDLNPRNESVIILAAGSSSRLGQSKQLVEIDGVPLLLRSTKAALDANYSNVVVVLGAHSDIHKKAIDHLPVKIITHPDWEKGMGSSLKAGLQHIVTSGLETNAVVVMVCDQPMIQASHLKLLRETYLTTSKKIVASRYGNTTGVPALFDQSLFPELLKIKDVQGARFIIEHHADTVAAIDWPDGSIDIDTPEDLKKFKSL